MSVGVTKDYKLKVRNLHASHTLNTHEGWEKKKEKERKRSHFSKQKT
jgi:hypothetical protein